MPSESYDKKFNNQIQNITFDKNQKDQESDFRFKEGQPSEQAPTAEQRELHGVRLVVDKDSLKRQHPEGELDDDQPEEGKNPCSLMQSRRVNKYNSKNGIYGEPIQKENDPQGTLKKAKMNEDVQTGSTYPCSNKENPEHMRPQHNADLPLMDITTTGNLGMPKEEDCFKSPKHNIKPEKQVTSLLKNGSPEYGIQKGANCSMVPTEDERMNKKPEGPYYINNITNNIIVDKKLKDQRNMGLLQSSGGRKKQREHQNQEKQCTCHLKYLDKSDPSYPPSLQRNMFGGS